MRSAIIDTYSAFRFVLGRPAHLFRFGLWPLVACVVMAVVFDWLAGVFMGILASLPGISGTASLATFLFLGGLPWSWFSAVLAVRWHRLVLTGEDCTSGFDAAFSQRIGHFFAWICLLDFLLVAVAIGLWVPVMNLWLNFLFLIPADGGLSHAIWPTAITLAAITLACGAYAFLLSQIALIFPSIAIDKPASWKEIWRLSEDRRMRNFLTLFFVTLAPVVALVFAAEIVSNLPDTAQTIDITDRGVGTTRPGGTPGMIETALTAVIGVAIMIVTVAATAVALSRMYLSGAGRISP